MREPFHNAKLSLNALIIALCLIAVFIELVNFFYYYILSGFLVPKSRRILWSELLNVYIIGFQMMVLFSTSLIIWQHFWNLPDTHDLRRIVQLWKITCFVVIAYSLGILWGVSSCGDGLEAATETAMLYGIDSYYVNTEWKLLWDELQYTKECCGVNSYTDWMDTSWMSEIAHLKSKSSLTKTYAPYACCQKDFINCTEHYSPTSQTIGRLKISLINSGGCLPIFMTHFRRLTYIVFALLMIALKLQISICAFLRFIFPQEPEDSSPGCEDLIKYCENNVKSDDTDLEAQGVLEVCSCGKVLKRGDSPCCRSSGGQEVVENICHCRNSEIVH